MKQPKGFITKGAESMVCKLNKSLYGLKQAPAVWYKTLADCLALIGNQSLWSEESIFVLWGTSNQLLAIAVCYVDDILLMSRDASVIENLKAHLKACFEFSIRARHSSFLGSRLNGRHSIFTSAKELTSMQNWRNSGWLTANLFFLPMEAGLSLEKVEKCSPELPFRELLGSLMYTMIATRPDILCHFIPIKILKQLRLYTLGGSKESSQIP